MLTTRPQPFFRIPGRAAAVVWKAEVRLIARIAFHFSTGNSSMGATNWMPALFPDVVRAQMRMLKEFDWAPWTPDRLAALDLPVHVVFGTRDRTVRPVHAERLAAALPHGCLTWIADGGHVVMEEVPERTNALILGTLEAVGLDSGR